MYRKNRQNMCKLTQSVFVSFTITYMRALKKHKILVINIFPLESFNGTIELKFKNPLVFIFLIYSFLHYRPESISSASTMLVFSSSASPSLFLYIFFLLLSQRRLITFINTFIPKRLQLVRFATFKSLSERKPLKKKTKTKKEKFTEIEIS